jgi:hypothetical protein
MTKKSTKYQLTIEADTEEMLNSVKELFVSQSESILPILEDSVKRGGGLCDPSIVITDDLIRVSSVAEDKGYVITPGGKAKGSVKPYGELTEGERYLLLKRGNLVLFQFEEKNVDLQIGVFPSLTVALQQIESEDIDSHIETIRQKRKELEVAKKGVEVHG